MLKSLSTSERGLRGKIQNTSPGVYLHIINTVLKWWHTEVHLQYQKQDDERGAHNFQY